MHQTNNQKTKVLKYMKEYGSITSLEAMKDLGVSRLASRINELRNEGIEIDDVYLESKNRFGEKVRYKKYFLKDNEES